MHEGEPFIRVMHPDVLKALTDSPTWERGERYFRDGRVGEVTRRGGALHATVEGGAPYRVKIWVRGDQLAYACTCPSAESGFFCKHCVAVALTWLTPTADRTTAPPLVRKLHLAAPSPPDTLAPLAESEPPPSPGSTPVTDGAARWQPGRVHRHLRALPAELLADLLLDLAESDEPLRARLSALCDPELP